MNPKNLLLEKIEPGIRIVKINRREALNALNSETLEELRKVFQEDAADPSIRVVIFTGEGEKAFIAGADIEEMRGKNAQDAVVFARAGHEVTRAIERMPQPVIAAVNGYALGGGTEMALACDFILASEKAVFAQPEVGLGIIPGFGGTARLAKVIGPARAKELIYSGRRVKAEEAFQMGLVNHVYPAGELMAKAVELATTISRNSAIAIQKAKRLLLEFSETSGIDFKLDAEAQSFGHLFVESDQREGMNAFVEKRKPAFRGL